MRTDLSLLFSRSRTSDDPRPRRTTPIRLLPTIMNENPVPEALSSREKYTLHLPTYECLLATSTLHAAI